MATNSDIKQAATSLADTFLAGEFSPALMHQRAKKLLIKPWPGLEKLTTRVADHFGPGTRPARRDLIRQITSDEPLHRWLNTGKGIEKIDLTKTGRPAKMHPARGNPSTWQLPPITTPIALARWLKLTETELQWFARPWRDAPDRLRHYRHHWLPKRRGGHRLIERPKDSLKFIQQQILHQILDHIPPHDAVHSFRPGHSIITYARPHCAQPALLKLDIADFFPTLHVGRVRAIFRTAGYPDPVANLLADLCTQSTPTKILTDPPTTLTWHQQKRLRSPHLPQGAPTSPSLSNLLTYRLDTRLTGLAKATNTTYTRYADDIAFSGQRNIANLAPTIGAILIEEGFEPNTQKTRLQRQSNRQQLAGTIINSENPNISRKTYDNLKATLHNCIKNGPEKEARQAQPPELFRQQLQGKIAWVKSLNPKKATHLEQMFAQIDWPNS